MEYRLLGRTGVRVSAIAFGTMTFGGSGNFFGKVGSTDLQEATNQIEMCIDAGVNLFDTADIYSDGLSESILGKTLGRHRPEVLIASKVHGRSGKGPNDVGQSRHHLIRACEASLRRLNTDYIDLYQVHGFDGCTALEEVICALTDLVRSGKVRYIGCSNYSAWQLMKALAVADRSLWQRYSSLQAYYSLLARELEHELVPLTVP